MLKLFKPYVCEEAIEAVSKVLRSGQLAEGPQVKAFEQELEEVLNKKNIVTVNSGTASLELAYELAGITKGDEVITTVFTCTATNIPLVRLGAKIIFCDIERDFNMSLEDLKSKITPKTKAVVYVHFGGNNARLDSIAKLCKANDIKLIEDAAQAILSDNWAKGDYACVSLQAIKSITSGDGGFIITKSREDYIKAKKLRWFGYDRELKQKEGDIDLDLAGYKYHMNDISASIGRANLKHIYKVKKHMTALKEIYRSYGIIVYPWLAAGFTDNLDKLKEKAEEQGFEVGQYHYRNDKYSIFGGRVKLPVMDEIESKYFFVPYHMGVSVADAHKIGKTYESTRS